jgi:hypothetical protein
MNKLKILLLFGILSAALSAQAGIISEGAEILINWTIGILKN